MNRNVYFVTLWLLYVGRLREMSEKRLQWQWTKAVLLDWGSSALDNTAAGFVGVSTCCYGFGYFTILMLAVYTDDRWKLAATYCNTIRCHHCGMMLYKGLGRPTPYSMPTRSTANIRVTVDSKCLHYLILYCKFLQSVYWKLMSFRAEDCL